METNKDNGKNDFVGITGYFVFNSPHISLDVWLETDGFFRLIYKEIENANSFAQNEEHGSYSGDKLQSFERTWKWRDADAEDSGTDATDLAYPIAISGENEIVIKYLEKEYKCVRK